MTEPTLPTAAEMRAVPELKNGRLLCSRTCPHNQNNHPSLAFSNMCQLNREPVNPSGGNPCWPALIAMRDREERRRTCEVCGVSYEHEKGAWCLCLKRRAEKAIEQLRAIENSKPKEA